MGIRDFFRARRTRFRKFRFRDWSDYAPEDQDNAPVLTLYAAMAVALMVAMSSFVRAQEPDSMVVVHAWCHKDADAWLLSESIRTGGDDGYLRVMADMDNSCVDANLHDVNKTLVLLLEKTWTVEHPDGRTIQFWLALDGRGNKAHVWAPVNKESI